MAVDLPPMKSASIFVSFVYGIHFLLFFSKLLYLKAYVIFGVTFNLKRSTKEQNCVHTLEKSSSQNYYHLEIIFLPHEAGWKPEHKNGKFNSGNYKLFSFLP